MTNSTLVITVAGTCTRFNREIGGTPVLKCLYHRGENTPSMLGHLLRQAQLAGFSRVIVVGGYQLESLRAALAGPLLGHHPAVQLVENPRYREWGSMESLYQGLVCAEADAPERVVFIEGDVVTDDRSFLALSHCGQSAFAIAPEPVEADHSVAAYLDQRGALHYLYDTEHQSLCFPEPIKAVYSSGQGWTFLEPETLFQLNRQLTETARQGTNLLLIEQYFGLCKGVKLPLLKWHNCNTPREWARAFLSGQDS